MSKLIIKNKFATTPNELLNDPEISLRAKGLYGYIQSKPDGWNFSAERISRESKEGLHAVRMALVELEKFGYLERIKSKGNKGFWETDYVLHSSPINPTCENPTLENPMLENPTSENYANNIKKDLTKQYLINKEEKKELDFLAFRETSFFKALTNYFGKTKESQQMPMSSYLNNLFINDKLEEFKAQTLAYIEYKSIKEEASHKWETYQTEWEKTDYVHLLKQIKTKPKTTIKRALI